MTSPTIGRRESFIKGAAAALGITGLAASRGTQAQAYTPSVSYPRDTMSAEKSRPSFAGDPIAVDDDPVHRAKRKLAEPLYQKLREIDSPNWSLSNFNERSQEYRTGPIYMHEMRSVRQWFKASVAMDQQRKRASAMDALRAEIHKLFESPLDELNKAAREIGESVVAEILKP